MEAIAGAFRKGRPALFMTPVFAVLLLFPSLGATLKCYSCNSHSNTSCSTPSALMMYSMTCPPKFNGCRKWHMFFKPPGMDSQERIARECASVKSSMCSTQFGANSFQRTVCECMADNCNAASYVKVNFILMGSVVLSLMVQLLGKLY